jgi:hypothetical protein
VFIPHTYLWAPNKIFNSAVTNFSQYEFTFKEVCDLLILYIVFNCQRFVDIRNNEVFIIKDDPLSVLFKVKAFHKSQAKDLLLNHISIIK